MYIVRTQTGDNENVVIHTFHFDSEADMNHAADLLARTGSRGFAAVTGSDESHGTVKRSWDKRQKFFGDLLGALEHTVQSGAYKDSIWEAYGYREECERDERETNAKRMSYFCTAATMHHVVGDLYKVVYSTPFND